MITRGSTFIVKRLAVDIRKHAIPMAIRFASQAAQASVTAQCSSCRERPRLSSPKSLVQGLKLSRPSSSLCLSETFHDVDELQSWPSTKNYKSDLVVVLDMDECLLHSQFISPRQDMRDRYRQYEAERSSKSLNNHLNQGLLARNGHQHSSGNGVVEIQDREHSTTVALYDEFELDAGSPVVDSFCVSLPDGDLVMVNKRPFLHEFLKEITSKFETHIFTAAMEVYASPVLDVLDPKKNMLSKRFYRDSCSVHEELGVYVKDLKSVLGNQQQQTKFNEKRVVLIDNNPLSFLANPSNGILVSNFYDDPYDETLPAVLDVLDQLDGMEDVRPRLQEMFNLEHHLASLVKVGKR
jgi:Dullard-like phosphatase family protein